MFEDALKIIFTVEGAAAISELGQIKNEVNGLGESAGKSGGMLSNIGGILETVGKVALTAGIAIGGFAIAMGVEAVKAATEAEAKTAIWSNTLRNASAQFKLSYEELTKGAEAAGDAAVRLGFDNEDAASAYAKLVLVTGSASLAQQGVTAAEDLARAKGMDLTSATHALSLAFEGQGRSLKDLGIVLPKVSSMLNTLQLVQDKVKNSADAFSKTLQGEKDRFQALKEKIMETVGAKVLGALEVGLDYILKKMEAIDWNKFANDMVAAFDKMKAKVMELYNGPLKTLWKWIGDNVIPRFKEMGMIIDTMVTPLIGTLTASFELLLTKLNLNSGQMKSLGDIMRGIMDVVAVLIGVALDLLILIITALMLIVTACIDKFKAWLDEIQTVENRITGFIDKVKELIDWISKIPSKIGIKMSTSGGGSYATGGTVTSGGLSLVGENGPELVSLPAGAKVFNTQQTQNMMGGNISININNPSVRSDNDINEIVKQVRTALGRQSALANMGAF